MLPPPIVEDDWDCFDGDALHANGAYETVVLRILPGADAIVTRWRLSGSADPWTIQVPSAVSPRWEPTDIDGGQADVQAAWSLAGNQVSAWGPNVVAIQTGPF